MLGRAVFRCALPVLLLAATLSCSGEGDPLSFSPASLPTARVGVRYVATIAVLRNDGDVGDISVEAGELPPGLALRYASPASTAAIEGTPEQAGVYPFRIAAWSYGAAMSFQRGHRDYRIEVEP